MRTPPAMGKSSKRAPRTRSRAGCRPPPSPHRGCPRSAPSTSIPQRCGRSRRNQPRPRRSRNQPRPPRSRNQPRPRRSRNQPRPPRSRNQPRPRRSGNQTAPVAGRGFGSPRCSPPRRSSPPTRPPRSRPGRSRSSPASIRSPTPSPSPTPIPGAIPRWPVVADSREQTSCGTPSPWSRRPETAGSAGSMPRAGRSPATSRRSATPAPITRQGWAPRPQAPRSATRRRPPRAGTWTPRLFRRFRGEGAVPAQVTR